MVPMNRLGGVWRSKLADRLVSPIFPVEGGGWDDGFLMVVGGADGTGDRIGDQYSWADLATSISTS